MNSVHIRHRSILQDIAKKAMLDRGLLPDFSPEVLKELDKIHSSAEINSRQARDLTDLAWSSIDNDDSRDLDQLTVAEALPENKMRILVAVADVDSLVTKGSAIDGHAYHNTSSVYTAAMIFPMLPELLSTDLSSLNVNEDRLAVVIEMTIDTDGTVNASDIYRARVRNKAQLTYNGVTVWLEGGYMPEAISGVPGLDLNLRMQDLTAQSMKNLRHINGALSLETIEMRPVFEGDTIRDMQMERKNRAKDIIEDFMVAANGVTARFLSSYNFPSIRRVVRTPKRWDRIVKIAADCKFDLPSVPDSKALEEFLTKQKIIDPTGFPDLSLAVIKLLGSGEYMADLPGGNAPGHFGLAVKDYAHSTAPNRRYADLITQRLLKSAIGGNTPPYGKDELDALAKHLTAEEDAVNKVERQVGKSAAALLLGSRIGQLFNAIVTGASDKGTWARLLIVPVEGKLVGGFDGLDVGDRILVKLVSTDVERGFIDLALIK